MNQITNKLDTFFKISEKGSNIKTEVLGGLTGFFAMAYIIFVNPIILGDAGMNPDAVFAATIFGAAIATLIMGIYAKFPLGLASCMSMNAFFTYTVVLNNGFTWEEALSCVLLSSILFLILSFSGIRVKINEAIPIVLRNAGSVGIGLFIAFIGLKNAGIIVPNESLMISFGSLSNPNVIIGISGILMYCILSIRKVNNAVILSMFFAVLVGLLINFLAQMGVITLTDEVLATLPSFTGLVALPTVPVAAMVNETMFVSIKNIPAVLTVTGIGTILTFTFLDFFGTTATLNAARTIVSDEEENQKIYVADAMGTFAGSLLGTSNITTYIESVSGITSGAKTGLMAVVIAILFLLSLFFYPLLSLFTSSVTCCAMVAIGIIMFRNVKYIDWHMSYEESIPAFLIIVMMPLSGSIALALCIGFLTYTIFMLVAQRRKEIHKYMYIISVISLVYMTTSLT